MLEVFDETIFDETTRGVNILARAMQVLEIILAAFLRRPTTLPMLGTNDALPFKALLLNCKVICKPQTSRLDPTGACSTSFFREALCERGSFNVAGVHCRLIPISDSRLPGVWTF